MTRKISEMELYQMYLTLKLQLKVHSFYLVHYP